MGSFLTTFRFCAVAFLALVLSFFGMAEEGVTEHLEWQLPVGGQSCPAGSVRVRTGRVFPERQDIQEPSFTGETTVSGQIGQSFIVCAHKLSTENFFQEVSAAVTENSSVSDKTTISHVLTLIEATGRLIIEESRPCPEYFEDQYPFASEHPIRSEKPFLVVSKRTEKSQDKQNTGGVTPSSFSIKPEPQLSLSGGGYDTDDHNDFKRPPFMPMPDKAMANLILLPTLNLPANWRDYLPFVGLYHWLTGAEPEGVTILVLFDNLPTVRFRISVAESRELVENLLNARQLLHWLAPRLSGREHLIQQLLELTAESEEQPNSLSEETLKSIQQQLAIVLEEPDTEFNLEFEYSELMGTFLRQNKKQLKNKQFPDIHQFGGDLSKAAHPPAMGFRSSEQAGGSATIQERGSRAPQKTGNRLSPDLENNGIEQGIDVLAGTLTHYTIKVHQTEYLISKAPVLSNLFTPVQQARIQLDCLDCQRRSILLSDVAAHAEEHTLNCSQCQQFKPGPGTIEARHRMLQAHTSSQCQQYCDYGENLPSSLPSESLNVLRFMFRFGTEETLLDLLQEFDLPIIAEHLQQFDRFRRTILHDLCQYASGAVLQAFMQRFQAVIEPRHLLMQDSYHWTPLHYLFQIQSENSVQEIIRKRTDLITPQILTLQNHRGCTLFHILFHRNFMRSLEQLFRQTLGQLKSNTLVLQDFSDLNILHILFAFGDNRLVYDFIDSQLPLSLAMALQAAPPEGETPLHTLCEIGTISAISRLIETCAIHMNSELLGKKRFSDGNTPLHLLFSRNNPRLTRLLLDYRYHYIDQKIMAIANNAGIPVLQIMTQNSKPYEASPWIHKGDLETKYLLKTILEMNPEVEWSELLSHMNDNEQLGRNTQLQMVKRELERTWIEEQSLSPSAPSLASLQRTPEVTASSGQNVPPPVRVKTTHVAECPICYNGMPDVCAATPCCGTQFHRECITRWIEGHNTCTNCRAELSVQQLVTTRMPNIVAQEEEPVPSATREDINTVDKDGLTQLHHAAIDGETHLIETLVRQGANLEARDYGKEKTPLHFAAEHGQTNTAVALIKAGTNLEAQDDYCKFTPLHWAVVTNEIETAMELIEQGANIEAQDQRGKTALLLASYLGQVDMALRLIKEVANLKAQDLNGWTLLHQAIITSKTEVALALINEVGNLEVLDEEGMTPLHMAASRFDKKVVIALVKEGANIQRLPSKEATRVKEWLSEAGITYPTIHKPLATERDEEVRSLDDKLSQWRHIAHAVQLAVGITTPPATRLNAVSTEPPNVTKPKTLSAEFSATLNIRSDKSERSERTDLHLAVKEGNPQKTLDLIHQRADLEARDEALRSDLFGRANQWLRDAGISPPCRSHLDKHGKTELHIAAENGNIDDALMLLEHGADRNARDHQGNTPLHLAAMNNRVEVIALLVSVFEADLEAVDEGQNTPLHFAAFRGHEEATKSLIQLGANPDARSDGEQTPLHMAATKDHKQVIMQLAIGNANFEAEGVKQLTPLHVAAGFGKVDATLALIKSGANKEASIRGATPLILAIRADKTEAALALVQEGASLQAQDKNGCTPLHIAVDRDRTEIALELIRKGAKLEAQDKDGVTPLRLAVSQDNAKISVALFQKGANTAVLSSALSTKLNQWLRDAGITPRSEPVYNARHPARALNPELMRRIENGQMSLYDAADWGSVEATRVLISRSAKVDITFSDQTPLLIAAAKGHTEIAKLLIDYGAQVNRLCHGQTPLLVAADQGQLETVRLLISEGAEVDKPVSKSSAAPATPLHHAARKGHIKIIEVLIDNGAQVSKLAGNYTPLQLAAKHGQTEAAMVLISLGAQVNGFNNDGYTPLHLAAKHGHTETARTLISLGAQVNQRSGFCDTPLHLAAKDGHTETARLLIKEGALANAEKYLARQNLLGLVARNGHTDTARMLITEFGMQVNQYSDWGPLHDAVQQGHTETVKMLMKYGASPDRLCSRAGTDGITPLSLARSKGHTDIVEAILAYKRIINSD